MKVDPKEVAILVVHGNSLAYSGSYAQAYAWPEIQMRQIRRHTPAGVKVIVYANQVMPEHLAFLSDCPEVELVFPEQAGLEALEHVWPARNWLVGHTHQRFSYLVTLDSDAFPVADDWLEHYIGQLSDAQPLVAVQRLENGDTHSDRCFMLFSSEAWQKHGFDYSAEGVVDAGGAIGASLEEQGLDWLKLNRSNTWNPHPLTAAIYDSRIYHHSAGSRLPQYRSNKKLWKLQRRKARGGSLGALRKQAAVWFKKKLRHKDWQRELFLHRALMDLLFSDTSLFVDRLQGGQPALDQEKLLKHGEQVLKQYP